MIYLQGHQEADGAQKPPCGTTEYHDIKFLFLSKRQLENLFFLSQNEKEGKLRRRGKKHTNHFYDSYPYSTLYRAHLVRSIYKHVELLVTF